MKRPTSASHPTPTPGAEVLELTCRRAPRIAMGALGAMIVAGALYAIAYAIGGDEAVSDNWVGLTVVVVGGLAMVGALAAFSLAVRAVSAGVAPRRLWLALVLLPLALLFVMLGEAFLWE